MQTFQKIEEILENYGLFHIIKEVEHDDVLDIKSAKEYCLKLDKTN